ncbi:MAG: PIN domain-containing protein [Candidatus Yanofskybacteria bacterium]|nr:PIN domain-containing protein [Candidatus Yanofskybacteria bacterium]
MGEKIGLDTSFWVYFLEENPEYLRKTRSLVDAIEAGRVEAVFSSIGLIEILTGPKRSGNFALARRYRELFAHFPNLSIWGMHERIVEIASGLRAQYGIATPDAIHIATAIDFGASRFITNDKGLRRVKEISVELLSKK